jgi:peptidoglycan/xylan/chitin deacetylase (PgdA/CDA1 family)
MRIITKQFTRLFCGILALIILLPSAYPIAAAADEVKNPEKTIYLTFDDGPSFIVTDKILDILKEKDVKGTFFIVGYKIENKEHILKRIYREGHSIGLHSYTHEFKKVYANNKNLINEMEKTANAISEVIGISPKIIRFPGGSKPHLNKALLDKLHDKNYKIFDWNACISDGIDYHVSSDTLYCESKRIIGKGSRVILLMHCDQMNMNTCKALPQIINFYKSEGFEFKAIEENTPELYFRITKSTAATK